MVPAAGVKFVEVPYLDPAAGVKFVEAPYLDPEAWTCHCMMPGTNPLGSAMLHSSTCTSESS